MNSHSMIVVNLFFAIFLSLGVIFYTLIYPKKKVNLFVLLILISVLPIISILRPGTYESGDFNIHIYRTIDFFKSLIEGNLMPSWAGGLNATYGYPLFIFNYTLPYYFLSLFHFLGFGYIVSEKIVLIIGFIFSGIFMFYFSKTIFKNVLASFVSSIFYLFTPYHLIDLHFKVALGELFIFTFLPVVFIFEHKLYYKKTLLFFFLSVLSIGLLIMSHAILAFFSILLVFFYLLFLGLKEKEYKQLFINFLSIFLGALLSIYIWLPPLILSKYTYTSVVPLSWSYFPNFSDLLYSPWRFGLLFQGSNGEISFLFGYTQIFTFLVALFVAYVWKKNKENINLIFWLLSFLIVLFLITQYSKPIWGVIPFMKSAGSHRLLLLLTFCISVIAGYVSIYFKKKQLYIYFIIFITIGYTFLNWGHRRLIPEINDSALVIHQPLSTSQGEGHYYANSKWINLNHLWFSKIPKNHLEIITGVGQIKEVSRTSTKHEYVVNAKTDLTLRENTLYFPGWTANSNEKKINIYPDKNGIINLRIPKGKQTLELNYKDIQTLFMLKLVSSATFITIALYFCSYLL